MCACVCVCVCECVCVSVRACAFIMCAFCMLQILMILLLMSQTHETLVQYTEFITSSVPGKDLDMYISQNTLPRNDIH